MSILMLLVSFIVIIFGSIAIDRRFFRKKRRSVMTSLLPIAVLVLGIGTVSIYIDRRWQAQKAAAQQAKENGADSGDRDSSAGIIAGINLSLA